MPSALDLDAGLQAGAGDVAVTKIGFEGPYVEALDHRHLEAVGLAGLGIIQIPRIAVREALRAGRLIEVLPGYRAEPLSLSLVYPQRRELSRRVNLFMQWLAGVMKEHLD